MTETTTRYKIYERTSKTEHYPDGYSMSSKEHYSLSEVRGVLWFDDTHNTLNDAIDEIEKYKDKLKHKILVVLPTVEITYD